MNTYPITAQSGQTRVMRRQSMIERFATNGTVRLRRLHSRVRHDIVVMHDMLSAADRATLLTFYSNNDVYPFQFTAAEDGSSYVCRFAPMPFDIEPIAGLPDYYQAAVYLRET